MLDLQYTELYLELVHKAENLAAYARMLISPTSGRTVNIERVAMDLAEQARKIYEEAIDLKEKKDLNFKPIGWIMDNGEMREMTQEELTTAMKETPPEWAEDSTDDGPAEDPLQDEMTFAKWKNGYESAII